MPHSYIYFYIKFFAKVYKTMQCKQHEDYYYALIDLLTQWQFCKQDHNYYNRRVAGRHHVKF
jgi:hypothetical protein